MKADGSGKFILSTGETTVYFGRDDEVRQHGVAIMLKNDAAKALINWIPKHPFNKSRRHFEYLINDVIRRKFVCTWSI